MSTKTNPTKIGLFVIVAVVLFVLGLLAFGAKSYFVSKTRLETAIPGEVYGLSVGSGVQLRGVPVGKVTEISFSWHTYPQSKTNAIIVEFEVEGPLLPLPHGLDLKTVTKQAAERGLRAIIKGQGITGTSILALESLDPVAYPPPPIDFAPRHPYIPSAPAQLTRLVESLGKSLTHLQEVDFAAVGQGVTNTLNEARQLVARLNEVDFKSLHTNANDLLGQLKISSVKLTETITDIQKSVNEAKLDKVSKNADGLLTELRGSNAKLQLVLDKLGSAPMQQTVSDLQQSLQSLNEVLIDLKAYPSGFLFGKPPQPVGGLQTIHQ